MQCTFCFQPRWSKRYQIYSPACIYQKGVGGETKQNILNNGFPDTFWKTGNELSGPYKIASTDCLEGSQTLVQGEGAQKVPELRTGSWDSGETNATRVLRSKHWRGRSSTERPAEGLPWVFSWLVVSTCKWGTAHGEERLVSRIRGSSNLHSRRTGCRACSHRQFIR